MQRYLSVLLGIFCVASLATGVVTANPAQPGTAENGLSENETAMLWSGDSDNYITQEEYYQQYGKERSTVAQVANGTDITFKRPPATAETWTRNDFDDLEAGRSNTSVHPSHAPLDSSVFIEDAHATIFGVHPSTRAHLDSDETPLYIAPQGEMRGFVDYRVRIPNGNSSGSTTVNWSLSSHEIREVRLKKDGETIARTDGSHTPVLEYQISGGRQTRLTLEADIHTRLKKTTRIGPGNNTAVSVDYPSETHTVADSIDVEIYDLSTTASYAEYPNGDTGVAIFQSRPWQGYTLTKDGDAKVRGVWRFYTARDANWDRLVRSDHSGSKEVASEAVPVYVHAYPSRIGPRAEPERDGPIITNTWGTERQSPVDTIGENVNIEVVNQSYTPTYGVAVRAQTVDRDALRVDGIVRGESASLTEPETGSERQLRRSNLSVEVVDQNSSHAALRVELRDNQTGDPIFLDTDGRLAPLGVDIRNGYITVDDQRLVTNESGVALLTVNSPGLYTATYHPGSWLSHNPAYVTETVTARWHPLGTLDGWFALIFNAGWQLIPFFVMFYAGRRLLRMLGSENFFE
jgi:hypothetical protein